MDVAERRDRRRRCRARRCRTRARAGPAGRRRTGGSCGRRRPGGRRGRTRRSCCAAARRLRRARPRSRRRWPCRARAPSPARRRGAGRRAAGRLRGSRRPSRTPPSARAAARSRRPSPRPAGRTARPRRGCRPARCRRATGCRRCAGSRPSLYAHAMMRRAIAHRRSRPGHVGARPPRRPIRSWRTSRAPPATSTASAAPRPPTSSARCAHAAWPRQAARSPSAATSTGRPTTSASAAGTPVLGACRGDVGPRCFHDCTTLRYGQLGRHRPDPLPLRRERRHLPLRARQARRLPHRARGLRHLALVTGAGVRERALALVHELGPGVRRARGRLRPRDARSRSRTTPSCATPGMLGLCIPERYGGMGASFQDYMHVSAELARFCPMTALTYNMHSQTVLWTGDPGRRPRHAGRRARAARAHPHAGSTAGSSTTARS